MMSFKTTVNQPFSKGSLQKNKKGDVTAQPSISKAGDAFQTFTVS
jgi:hypothetical protein